MVAFLKSIDNKTYKAVVKGQKHLVITFQDGTSILMLEDEQTNTAYNETLGNSKYLNDIFNGVYKHMFRLINTCIEGKDAQEILETAHEGASKIRMSMLQLLTKKFVNLRMNEEESISDFNIKLRDMANTSFALGERMPE